jgi:hypothetical protein
MARPEPNICSQKWGKGRAGAEASIWVTSELGAPARVSAKRAQVPIATTTAEIERKTILFGERINSVSAGGKAPGGELALTAPGKVKD